jgi:hypothetical protein
MLCHKLETYGYETKIVLTGAAKGNAYDVANTGDVQLLLRAVASGTLGIG